MSLCKIYGSKLFLIFLPTPILIFIPPLEWARSLYYITFSVIFSTASILINFPKIIHFLHGKSVSFEDLEDEHAVDTKTKKRFQTIFEITITVTLAILMGALIDYYLDRFGNTKLSNLEILGIIGGFMSLLYKIEDFIGKLLLIGLHCYKKEFSPKSSSILVTCQDHIHIPELELEPPV